jgi:cellulose synthase/poly-beta-1,6-N-acetylglucosamine synthase-like glycosyltransferase
VSGSISAMRRTLWTPLPAGLILDDVYAPMRVVLRGYRVAFVSEARATETRPVEPSHEYHRKVRTLTGVLQLCAWLPEVLSPVRNPIWLQFVIHKLLRLLTPYCILAATAWLGTMAAGWLREHEEVAFALALGSVAPVYWARARVLRVMREGLLIQAAVVIATVNGLRGRWDVWR